MGHRADPPGCVRLHAYSGEAKAWALGYLGQEKVRTLYGGQDFWIAANGD